MRSGAIIYPLLRAYGALTDLVSSEYIFALRAEQPTKSSYIVYREISSIPLNTKGVSEDNAADPRIQQRSLLETSRVQISVFSRTYLKVEDIAVKVREALDREWGTVNAPYNNDIYVDSIVYESSVDDYDDNAENHGLYIKHLDFTIRANRLIIDNTWTNNYSLIFDGVDDYLTFGDNALWSINSSGGNRGFSLSIWTMIDTVSTEWIVSKTGAWDSGAYRYEWELLVRFNGQLRFRMYFNDTNTNYVDFDSDDLLTVDTWYHIVITYDLVQSALGLNMYIDNNLKNTTIGGATVTLTGVWTTVSNTTNPMYLARSSGLNYSLMKLDEFSIWDRALSASDVSELYGSGATGDPNRFPVASIYLVGYWRCGDGATFPNIPDASPQYSNQGVMTNMAADDINTNVPT